MIILAPEIDVVNSSPSELLASPLNTTIQQNVNEDSSFKFKNPWKLFQLNKLII